MRRLYTCQKLSIEHFEGLLSSCFFSYSYSASRYSYSYSKLPSIASRPIGPQVPANRFDQRSAVPRFEQPSSTSTVRRGGLSTALLSTTKSDARHERKDHRGRGAASSTYAMPYPVATSRKPLLGWNAPGPRSARPTGSTASSASGRLLHRPHEAAWVVKWEWWR